MACFIAPAAEAVVVTVAKKVVEKKKKNQLKIDSDNIEKAGSFIEEDHLEFSFSTKLGWLANLLWGGSFLLLIEHIWHGEIVPWAPFLTAMGSPEDTAEMLKEIATVGVSMAVLITVIWAVMAIVANLKEKKNQKESKAGESIS